MGVKQDFNSLYASERIKYDALTKKETPLTTSGSENFTSISSGQIYSSGSGEMGMLTAMQSVLSNYIISADNYNELVDGVAKINVMNGVGSIEEKANKSALANYVKYPAYVVTTGVANTYVATLSPAPTSYVDGLGIVAKINISSTGNSTMNVNTLGAIPMKDGYGNYITNFKANTIYSFRFEAVSQTFMLQGASTPVNTFSQASDPAIYSKENDIWFDLTTETIKRRVGSTWKTFSYTYA